MTRLARAVGRVGGWRRLAIAFCAGVLAAGAMAPFFVLPLLIPAFVLLLWMVQTSRGHVASFAIGWSFGFGFFGAGMYWVGNAFAVAAIMPWLAPFAVVLLAASLALFAGLATWLVACWNVRGIAGVMVFAAAWSATEWLRGYVILGGLPWNLIGYAWAYSATMMQITAYGGIFALSFVTVVAATAPAVMWPSNPCAGVGQQPRRATIWMALALIGLVPGLLWAGGVARLAATVPAATMPAAPGPRLRIVQANIAQHHKWRDDLRVAHFNAHVELTLAPGLDDVDAVIWPETAVPFLLENTPEARAAIGRLTDDRRTVIAGAVRAASAPDGKLRYWNSLHAVAHDGDITATYDKFHLVPFGEYFPFRAILDVAKLTVGDTDFSRGPGPQTITAGALPPFSPLICYEAIFPGAVVKAEQRPAWLLNVTNDAWYGISPGPYQHLAQARTRSIEEGLPLVRAANTGISLIADAYGREIARLDLGTADVLDATLPSAIAPTVYARLGNAPILVLVGFILAAATIYRVTRNSKMAA